MSRPKIISLGLLLTLLLSACILPGFFTPPAAPTPTPIPLPPALVETDPPAGSLIKPQQSLAFFFSQPMNRASVESALTLENRSGIFTWLDDSTLTFTPAAPLPADSTAVFRLAAGAQAANGLTSLEAQSVSFTVAGALRLTQNLPADGAADVSPITAIVASFNQPVTALGADPASLPAAFSLEPAASGRGEWLNTSAYIFYPEPALASQTQYTARLNPALTSSLGSPLETASAWTFHTALPRLLEITPNADAPVQPRPQVTLLFNQPMNPASLENGAATVTCDRQNQTLTGWEWNERQTQATFTFAGDLPRGANCQTQVAAALARSVSGASLAEDASQTFSVFQLLGLAQTPVSPKVYNQSFQASLTAQLANDADLNEFVSVSPPVPNFSANGYGTDLHLDGDFAAEQTYTFTLASGLPDAYGETLRAPVTFSGFSLPPDPALTIPYAPLIFVRPDQPAASIQIASLSQIQMARAPLSLPAYMTLNDSYEAQQAFDFSGGISWQVSPPYLQQASSYDLPLAPDGTLAPGLYFVQAASDQITNTYSRSRTFFLLSSNVNLTFKADATSALVWAVDVRSGQPISGGSVVIYDKNGAQIGGGFTAPNGLWRGALSSFDGQGTLYAVLGLPGEETFGLATSQFNPGLSPWEMGIASNRSGATPFVYLYSDRPVYRPGDTIHLHGMLRQVFNGRYADLPGGAAGWELVLLDSLYQERESHPIALSAYGALDAAFTLPVNATPGGWSLEVREPADAQGNRPSSPIYFQVADYRKPELNLAVTFAPAEIAAGQTAQANVQVDYFFGAPARDVPLTWTLYRQTSRFGLPGYEIGPYETSWSDSYGSFGETVQTGMGSTDAEGVLRLTFDNLPAQTLNDYRLEVTASETGGFPVSASGGLTVHPGPTYAGIRPAQYVGRAGQALKFDLLSANWQKQPQPNTPLSLVWEKVTWKNRADRYGTYSYTLQATALEQTSLTTDGQGAASAAFTPTEAGTYRLRASAGNSLSDVIVWVGGAGQAVWPVLPFDRIQLTAAKTSYEPGETASVFLPNPFDQPAQTLLTLERGQVLDVRLLTIAPGGESVDFALTDDNAPNTFVSATLLGPGVQFRQGYLELKVAPRALTLNVTLTAAPQTARPGESVTLNLQVSDSAGQPVRGEFSLAVVDLAALALADPNAPDILPAFYDPQPLGVLTGLTDAMDSRRLLPQPGGMGGGGGEASLTLRENFPDTALWTTFETDSSGAAQVNVTLPDNLTTWQVDARGLDRQSRVGQARLQIVTRKELLLRPQTPRFLVVGDRARVGTLVNNTTASDFDAEVSLEATGVTLAEGQNASQKVAVPAGGRAAVWWWVTADAASSARLVFSARAGAWSDATLPVDGEIPIVTYAARQTFSTGGVLSAGGTRREIVSLPRRFEPLDAELRLELTPSLAVYLRQAAESLATPDEFASNEQLASYLLAAMSLPDAAITPNLLSGEPNAVRVLLAHQNGDGGWSWYGVSDYQITSDPLWTAYALLALDEGYTHGALPFGDWNYSLQNAHEFLTNQIAAMRPVSEMNADELDLLSFLIYALVNDSKRADNSLEWAQPLLADLNSRADLLAPASRALNYASLMYFSSGDQPELLDQLEALASRSATGAFWQTANRQGSLPASPVYQTAVTLQVLAERRQPASPQMQEALRYLVFNRMPGGNWASGLETAWAYRALAALLYASGEPQDGYSFGATLNGQAFVSGQGTDPQVSNAPLASLYRQSPNDVAITRGQGGGTLFYRLDLQVARPAQDAPAFNGGIVVSRAYFDCSTRPCQPITSWKMSGQPGRITARVTLTLPTEMRYVTLEDYAPAGAEIANPALKTSQQGGAPLETEFFTPEDPFGSGWGWWYFGAPQIFRDHIAWNAVRLPAGTYELTYTLVPSLAGEFQVRPARAWQVYFPEVQGSSAGSLFKIEAP